MKSTYTTDQTKTFRKEYTENGHLNCIVAYVRHDDRCGNGHNTFSITGTIYDRPMIRGEDNTTLSNGKRRWLGTCGAIHSEILKHFPELAPLIKWHLVSVDGPMHYFDNTIYFASKKDWDASEKLPELDAARISAIWHDATDDDLTAPGLRTRLENRLPALMKEFQAAVESLGFTY